MTKDRIMKEIENRIEQLQKKREKLYTKEISQQEMKQAQDEIDTEIYTLMAMLEVSEKEVGR